MKNARKIFHCVLSGVVGSSMLFTSGSICLTPVLAAQEDAKDINLGSSVLESPFSATSEEDNWQGDYVYYGNYQQIVAEDDTQTDEKEPVLWKVLDPNATQYNTKETILMMTDKVLDQQNYEDTLKNSNWNSSLVHTWLNSTLYNDLFSSAEKNSIVISKKNASEEEGILNPALTDEHLFLLSALESLETSYGFGNEACLLTQATEYAAEQGVEVDQDGNASWWLRSLDGENQENAETITQSGGIQASPVDGKDSESESLGIGIAPATNINKDKVVFTSAAEGGKASLGEGLVLAENRDTNQWKFTLSDSSKLSAPSVSDMQRNGNKLTFSYSSVTMGENHYLSAVILDSTQQNVIAYGKLADAAELSNGEVTVTLPENFDLDGYVLKVFSEQDNGDYQTDYASIMTTVTTSKVVTPIASVESGSYTAIQNITLSTTTPNATLYYTLNGTEPVVGKESTLVYSGNGISIASSMTLKVLAVANGMINSDISQYDYEITLPQSYYIYLNNTENGSVTISPSTVVPAGTIITVTATPNAGYQLKSILINNEKMDGDTFTMPEADVTVDVNFEKITYTINASADPSEGGSVSGAGTVEYGGSITLKATANSGYTFSHWTENGEKVSSSASIKISEVTKNHTYIAVFTKNSSGQTTPTPTGSTSSGDTSSTTSKSTSSNASTADQSQISLWMGLAFAGILSIVAVIFGKKHKRY